MTIKVGDGEHAMAKVSESCLLTQHIEKPSYHWKWHHYITSMCWVTSALPAAKGHSVWPTYN